PNPSTASAWARVELSQLGRWARPHGSKVVIFGCNFTPHVPGACSVPGRPTPGRAREERHAVPPGSTSPRLAFSKFALTGPCMSQQWVSLRFLVLQRNHRIDVVVGEVAASFPPSTDLSNERPQI